MMLLHWQAIMEAEKSKCSRLSEAEKFVYFLLLQYRNPYGWGKENFETADCSGSVCLAIMMSTGCLVRTTANGLLQKFFTNKKPQDGTIQAAFFVAQTDRRHGNRVARKGDAIHVAGSVGQGVLFNSVMPLAELRTLEDLRKEYEFKGCDCTMRGLDRDALQKAHDAGSDLFGLETDLELYTKEERSNDFGKRD